MKITIQVIDRYCLVVDISSGCFVLYMSPNRSCVTPHPTVPMIISTFLPALSMITPEITVNITYAKFTMAVPTFALKLEFIMLFSIGVE